MRVIPWTTLVLGAWLILSPFTIPYEGPRAAYAEDMILGALIVLSSLVSAGGGARYQAALWLLAAFGVWVAIAPFVLGYYRRIVSSDAVANDMVVGSLVFLLAVIFLIAVRNRTPYTEA